MTNPRIATLLTISILPLLAAPLPARQDQFRPRFAVALPAEKLPFPTPLPAGRTAPGFKLIGTKGWAWTWDQFLAEVPVLAAYKMNFLMSCYTCVFTDTEKFVNRWWEPFPEKTKNGLERVARACRENGITFCFSMHPQLFSERPLKHDSAEDFEALWKHYAYVQDLGVKWFSLSYDDIDTKDLDKSALGRAHAGLANKLLRRLREKDPGAELIFCPVYYWGCGDTGDAGDYLKALGSAMDRDILVFWTGDDVVTLRITRACAERYKAAVGHRIFIWDNLPVNDRTGALHLGPLTGRDPDLDEVAYGYMSNPHCPQNEINRIPLLTCADYAYNPRAYDPARSIGQAIVHLAETQAEREALKDLVELYPGNLISGSVKTSYNSVLDRLDRILGEPNGREIAPQFIDYVEHIAARFGEAFPGRYAETKRTLTDHIAKLKAKWEKGREATGTLVLAADALKDKIKGGWAGQTIGCTFGRKTEFQFQGTLIHDYQPLPWNERAIAECFRDNPGLYDDVYMDLTFVEVFAKEGLDAPAASFARAFADAPYPLWHANQMARYNILRGIMPPRSGEWRNNPHADDIDFQIEADFAGLMSPGMPGAAAAISDRIGHIMNSGDGWYGGVYIAAMYSLAFIRDDIGAIAEEALQAIPAGTDFAQAMADVIRWHREDPSDWKSAWFKTQRAWGEDVGCPEGVFSSFDIDAKINCAWVLIGLLYGGGDFEKTLSISQRCGDDSDCNPATAGGILGTMLGYRNIPAVWTSGLQAVEDRPFPYTTISLTDACRLSYEQAIENIRRNGGSADADRVSIAVQPSAPVALEINFAGHRPVERMALGFDLGNEGSFRFTGIGFAANGEAVSTNGQRYVFRAEMIIDGKSLGTFELPTDARVRNPTPFWAYGLEPGPHDVVLRVLNPAEGARLRLTDAVIYAEKK